MDPGGVPVIVVRSYSRVEHAIALWRCVNGLARLRSRQPRHRLDPRTGRRHDDDHHMGAPRAMAALTGNTMQIALQFEARGVVRAGPKPDYARGKPLHAVGTPDAEVVRATTRRRLPHLRRARPAMKRRTVPARGARLATVAVRTRTTYT